MFFGNQNGSIVAFLFIFFSAVTVLLSLYGNHIRKILWEKDTFVEHQIKPRIYGIVVKICFTSFLFIAFLLLIYNNNVTMACLVATALIGYVLICWDTYSTKLRYTKHHIFYNKRGYKLDIHVSDIVRVCWECGTRSIGYMLVIYLQNGKKIHLSQEDFIGLREFAEFIDRKRK